MQGHMFTFSHLILCAIAECNILFFSMKEQPSRFTLGVCQSPPSLTDNTPLWEMNSTGAGFQKLVVTHEAILPQLHISHRQNHREKNGSIES